MFPGEPGDIQDFVVIDASQHDAVDFHGMETQGSGLLEARHDCRQVITAGDLAIAIPLQGIQADIEVAHAGVINGRGQFREQHPVGGEADLVDAGKALKLLKETHYPPAY